MWYKVNKIYVGTNLIRPVWKPDPNRTLLYLKFDSNTNDSSWNNVSVSSAGVWYWTIWNKKYVEMTWTSSTTYIKPEQTLENQIGPWDFTVSFFIKPVSTNSWTTNGNWALPFWFWYDQSQPYEWIQIQFNYYGIAYSSPSIPAISNKVIIRTWSLNYSKPYIVFDTNFSDLVWSWHHILVTRINWVVYCYLDWWVEKKTFNYNGSFNCNRFYILNRDNYTWQAWSSAWARMSEVIFEKVWWTQQEVSNYYNQIKSNYWL